jgi:predicted ABC-class ATPase
MVSIIDRHAGVRASFAVSGNDRPHPDLLPTGEGTAIAGVSLRGCASGESSQAFFDQKTIRNGIKIILK